MKLNEEIMKKYTVSTDVYSNPLPDPYLGMNPYVGSYSSSTSYPTYPPSVTPTIILDFCILI